MAEFVQLRKEKWIEAVSWLRKLEILNKDEFGLLMTSIDGFEYKIQSPNRKLEDVLSYIEFLCNLLKHIQRRRNILKQHDKTEKVDRFIYNEICSQFGSAEINFGHNIDFWNARLKFVATVVPERDRENEFNRVFKQALNYCARAHLDFYKYCVDFQWSLLKIAPPARFPSKKRKRQRRDCSKLMAAVREITRDALRNFRGSSKVSIWVLTTELKYLCLLKEEQDNHDEKDIPFDLQDETTKTEGLIKLYYEELQKKKQMDVMVYCQLYEAVSEYNVEQAKELSKEVLRQILSVKPTPLEVFVWLIDRSIDENKIDECVERISQALYSSPSKIKVLNMCVGKLNTLLGKLDSTVASKDCLSKLLQFSMKLFDPENSEWREIKSEKYLTSRVQFIKTLPKITAACEGQLDEELVSKIKSYLENYKLHKVVLNSVTECPSSFELARERVYYLLSKNGKPIKPLVIFNYLSHIDWKSVSEEDARNLLFFVYRIFLVSPSSKLQKKVDKLLKLPINHLAMNQLRILHLRKAYLEDGEVGRKFYLSCSRFSSDWRFSCAVLEIERDRCHGAKEVSPVFRKALEDVQRLTGTSSTEPWKIGIASLYAVGKEIEASQLLERALAKFSLRKELSVKHKEMTMFASEFKKTLYVSEAK